MKKAKILIFMFLFVLVISVIPTVASADTGPKPSVNLSFTSAESLGESFYVTLLSETKGAGPWYYDEERPIDEQAGIDPDIWNKFLSYDDPDGFYLLPFIRECTSDFVWGYYPPSVFKILIYSPKTDSFAVSKIYERYAFDSYYAVSLSEFEKISFKAGDTPELFIKAEQSYEYLHEIRSLIARMLITVAIEIIIAMLFGYRGALTFLILIAVNIATQLGLNLYLNYDIYLHGPSLSYRLGGYLFIELLILFAEGSIYLFTITKTCDKPSKKTALSYAAIANIASFIIGLFIASRIPELF